MKSFDNYIADNKINITELNLDLRHLTNERTLEMVKTTRSTLVELGLRRLSFDDHSSFSSFFECLSEVKQLKEISFNTIEILYKPKESESLKNVLLLFLKNCENLNCFYIRISKFSCSSHLLISLIEALAEAKLEKLKTLRIYSDDVCHDQGEKLFQLLNKWSDLNQFSIGNVIIGSNSADSFVEALKKMHKLRYLSLINTNIGYGRVISIIKAMIKMECLNEIEISKNEINKEVYEFIDRFNENEEYSHFISKESKFSNLVLKKKSKSNYSE